MKKTPMLLLCAFLAGTILPSCKKDEKKPSSGTPPTSNTNQFSLTVDGVNTVPTTINVQEAGGVVVCNGIVNANTSYTISTEDGLMPGTYAIDANTPFDILHSDDNNATFYASYSGSVTVTTHDTVNNRIAGNFNCTLTRVNPPATKTVTNGQFNFSYN